MSSIALLRPTSRARRCVPPVPGRTPSDTSGSPILPLPLRRDAQVAGHRHLEPAADAVAVDGRDHQLRRLLEPIERLVRVQAEVVLERRLRRRQHLDVGAGAEELVAVAAHHEHVRRRRPCARAGWPRRAPASSRSCRCWPADRRASASRRRRRRSKRTFSPMAGDDSELSRLWPSGCARSLRRCAASGCAARPTTRPPSQVTIMSRLHRSHGMRKRHEADSEPRTLVSQPHQGQGNSKLM